MNSTLDTAYKIGCGRLHFARGSIQMLGCETRRLGKRALIVTGRHAWQDVQSQMIKLLKDSKIEHIVEICESPCSEEKAEELKQCCRTHDLDVIIGVGGGRIMDLVKIAADISGLPVITVPTISATCAAYTPLSVVYTPEGACRGTWYFHREVECVICDLDILCDQPQRYLAAGMLDAMAKHVEILHHQARQQHAGQDVLLAKLLAQTIYDDLLRLGHKALKALKEHQLSSELERCIFHTIVTTGMVSGIARGQYQSAVAHALYEAIRTCYTEASRPFLHGEVVAVGLILQAEYLGRPDIAAQLRDFMQAAGMPVTLSAIGVTGDVDTLATHTPIPRYYLNGPEDAHVLGMLMKICLF